MPCIPLPKDSLPSLPDGITIVPPVPLPPSGTIIPEGACCKLPALTIPKVPLPPLPPALLQGLMATLNEIVDQVLDYLDHIPVDCPIE